MFFLGMADDQSYQRSNTDMLRILRRRKRASERSKAQPKSLGTTVSPELRLAYHHSHRFQQGCSSH